MVAMAAAQQQVDRAALAARIQGFGNVNPPPLPEDTAGSVAKRAVGNIGDMLGEEVMLTVQDFKEKGAVGAVKDAVADAGDILIDGVSSIFGWVRGDPPPEEEDEASEDAAKALTNGPRGAAYGVSQASPTGGINAVWVMPEEADPTTMAQLMAQQQQEARGPSNIQPYTPQDRRSAASLPQQPCQQSPMVLPGGKVIEPYQPGGAGGTPAGIPPYLPRGSAGGVPPPFQFQPGGIPMPMPSPPSGGASGIKILIEQISQGQVIPGPESAKRLVSQSTAAKVTAKQLAEAVCERTRRLYLGLDGGSVDTDTGLLCLLTLVDALAQLQDGNNFCRDAVKQIKEGVPEELLSLRSSASKKAKAELMLQRLGLVSEAKQEVNLLGDDEPASAGPGKGGASDVDLLGTDNRSSGKDVDLLGF